MDRVLYICERDIGALWTIEVVLEACCAFVPDWMWMGGRIVLLYQIGCGWADEAAKKEGSTPHSIM
jgi:hypothetical protein